MSELEIKKALNSNGSIMSTVSKDIAELCAKHDGYFPGDPQCYAVVKYKNSFFNNEESYKICYTKSDFLRLAELHKLKEILWSKEELSDYILW